VRFKAEWGFTPDDPAYDDYFKQTFALPHG